MTWQQRPVTLQIDYDQLIWQALLNVENSFQGLETESKSAGGMMMMTAKVSLERFQYNVLKLGNYILKAWQDSEYKSELERSGEDPFKLHKAIIELLNRRDFFKHKENIEEIKGQLPKEFRSLLSGQSTDSDNEKTASSS